MPLPTLFGERNSTRRWVWVMGLGWFMGVAGRLIFHRFVSHDSVRLASDVGIGFIYLLVFICLYVFLTILAKNKPGYTLSITNPDRDEAQERVNRSSPEVKEQ